MRRPCRMAGFAHPCAQPCFPGRFREVWRAARFSRSLGLKQRLSCVDDRRLGIPAGWGCRMLSPLGVF